MLIESLSINKGVPQRYAPYSLSPHPRIKTEKRDTDDHAFTMIFYFILVFTFLLGDHQTIFRKYRHTFHSLLMLLTRRQFYHEAQNLLENQYRNLPQSASHQL